MILPNLPPFIRFSNSHIVIILLSLILFVYLPYMFARNPKSFKGLFISKMLGIILITNEIGWVIYKLSLGHKYWAEFLPLELCTINAYLLGIILIFRPSFAIFEIVYFWSMAGTIQGIITPRLFAGYPHYLFFEYFITHTGVVLATLVLIFKYNWKLTWLSMWKSFLWLQIVAIINLVVDFTFEVNYMFMREPPKVSSVIDYFGPWPGYIFVCEIFALLSFIFYLIPFLLVFPLKRLIRRI